MPPSDIDPVAFAERHRHALHRLIDHILAHAGEMYTGDFEQQVSDLINTLDHYAGRIIDYDPGPDDGLDHAYRSHSYVTAQCSALLMFAHNVSGIAAKNADPELSACVKRLWTELSRSYRVFFHATPLT